MLAFIRVGSDIRGDCLKDLYESANIRLRGGFGESVYASRLNIQSPYFSKTFLEAIIAQLCMRSPFKEVAQ